MVGLIGISEAFGVAIASTLLIALKRRKDECGTRFLCETKIISTNQFAQLPGACFFFGGQQRRLERKTSGKVDEA